MDKRTAAGIALVLTLIACTTPTVVVPSPTPSAAPTPTAMASPAGSPTASPRALRPFTGVVPLAPLGEASLAPDRGRVAYLTNAGDLAVLDGSEQARIVRQPQAGFRIELDPHGLRGDTLVFLETRTDGQRTDARVMRADLAANTVTTLDDHSGPFLGGGDTWRPRAPVTNGRDVAWIRVDNERAPFGVHVVHALADARPHVVHSGSSIVWIDLHEQGRLLVSKLISANGVAELELWSGGHPTPIGNRPSAEGGPALFVGERVFWQRGSGIVARSERGDLIEPFGVVRPVHFPGCGVSGATGRFLLIHCGNVPETALLDPVSGERFALPGSGHRAGPRAVAWREADQWWLGTIAP